MHIVQPNFTVTMLWLNPVRERASFLRYRSGCKKETESSSETNYLKIISNNTYTNRGVNKQIYKRGRDDDVDATFCFLTFLPQ